MNPMLLSSAAEAPATGWLFLAWPPLTLALLWLLSLPVLNLTRSIRRPAVRLVLLGTGILISGWLTTALGVPVGLLFLLVGGVAMMIARVGVPGQNVTRAQGEGQAYPLASSSLVSASLASQSSTTPRT